MRKLDDLPKLKGYVSLKEWSVSKKISRARAHILVRNGSLRAFRIGEQIVLPEETEYPVSVALSKQMERHLKAVAKRNNKPVAGLGGART